ncbi:MAG: hypothetical protein HY731_11810 [Candidatus Tectomicrobia bacterium]|nr:hypothetical protein [Candidatus Tectomicrobia bacterium]
MATWIEVNGAKIEEKFLEENIAEAKTYKWEYTQWPSDLDHSHCMICTIASPRKRGSPDTAYKSEGGWLCAYCYENFVKNGEDFQR